MSDFIVKDDDVEEYDPLDPRGSKSNFSNLIQNMFRRNPNQYYDEESDLSDMEANYDQIEEEERRTARIAKQEDAE